MSEAIFFPKVKSDSVTNCSSQHHHYLSSPLPQALVINIKLPDMIYVILLSPTTTRLCSHPGLSLTLLIYASPYLGAFYTGR